MSIQIAIRRYDPETDAEDRWDEYTVPSGDRTTVLEALSFIYENLDPTLAFASGCRFGSCGLCAVEVNGQPRMACSATVKAGMKIAPLAGMPVQRDLVIDRTAYFDGLRKLRIFIREQSEPGEPRIVRVPKLHARLAACLECLACNSTCPSYDFSRDPLAGPYLLVKLAQLQLDPRDAIDRRRQAQDLGMSGCADCRSCYCIRGLDIRRDVLGVLMDEGGS
jgi:succinate dehydrogenase/fumarate reductase iron-sulfur protein